jgi:hypothetical protein
MTLASPRVVLVAAPLDEVLEAREVRRDHLAHGVQHLARRLESTFRLPVHAERDAARRITERLERGCSRIGLLAGLSADALPGDAPVAGLLGDPGVPLTGLVLDRGELGPDPGDPVEVLIVGLLD